MSCESDVTVLHLSGILPQYHFSILQLINRYGFYILNAYLPSEATKLNTNITLDARKQWRHLHHPLSSKRARVYGHVIRVFWLKVTYKLCERNMHFAVA